MSTKLAEIRELIATGQVVVSEHAKNELEKDALSVDEVIAGVTIR